VAFSYFLLMIMVGWVKRRPEWHPEWLIWLPTLVFLGLGVQLFRRLATR
jgi:lipopolysaccharide export system permease protein